MTLMGSDTAIVSLGVSCQTAHQLRINQSVAAGLTGEDMAVVRTPFEWMLTPLDSLVAMIRAGEYFPYSLQELDWCVHPYWSRYDCFFWHEDIAFAHPTRFHMRFLRATERLESTARMRRRIFIVSNTQNALEGVAEEAGGFDYSIDDARLDTLQAALDERFGPSELYAIGYPHTMTATGDRAFYLAIDESSWTGDQDQWAEVLRSIIGDRGATERRMALRAPSRSFEADAEDSEAHAAEVG